MANLLKITSRILGGILEWVLFLLIFALFAIRYSAVQTYVAGVATDFLSKEMKAEFHIGKVDIFLFDQVELTDVFVRDPKGDTLASLGTVRVRVSLLNLNPDKPVLNEISLEDGRVAISRDSVTGDYNYFFITDYFDSKPSGKPKKKTDVTIRELNLKNIHFTYDDNRKGVNDYGMDYDHLDFTDLFLYAHDFTIKGKEYRVELDKLSAREKSGLKLQKLSTSAFIGDKGIFLKQLQIRTMYSKIYADKFNLRMEHLTAMNSFEDSVSFDARIDSSDVNLYDVSLFAPALKGMKQRVWLSAGLYQKVPNLKITDIDLRTGEKTIVRGSLLLPDFRDPEKSFIKESIDYAYIDLKDVQALRLPDKVEKRFIDLSPQIDRVGYAELKKTTIEGSYSSFVLISRQIRTDVGTIHLDKGMRFKSLKEGGYAFARSRNTNDYDVYIDSFNLGKFLDDPLFGQVKGSAFVSGVVGQKDDIRLTELAGEFGRFDFKDYSYRNIYVTDGSFINNIFDADINIDDPNLQLVFDGYFNLNRQQEFNFTVDIPAADLTALHLLPGDTSSLVASFAADVHGTGMSDYSGKITLDQFRLVRDSNAVNIPSLVATIDRGADNDALRVQSDIANISANGKVDFATIGASLNNAFVPYLSSYFSPRPFPRNKVDRNRFDLNVTIGNPGEILAIFAPGLSISRGTKIDVHYDAPANELTTDITSGQVIYNEMVIRSITGKQQFVNGNATAVFRAAYFELNDSLFVRNVDLNITGTNNNFATIAKWNDSLPNPARFDFTTQFNGKLSTDTTFLGTMQTATRNNIMVNLRPSFFTVKNHRFDIKDPAKIVYASEKITIDSLVIRQGEQFVALNGIVSNNEKDELRLNLNDIHLEEFSALISPDLNMAGVIDGDVVVATPFKALRLNGGFNVKDLVISGSPVGDINFTGKWDAGSDKVVMNGDLRYLGNETFDFAGNYYPYSETNNLDFDLKFDGMDLGFANGFMDPDVVSNIGGAVRGNLKVKGKLSSPQIDGKLDLSNGKAKIALLGTTFRMNGPIKFIGSDNAFEITRMPVLDEEGNKAVLEGYIYHTDYSNWNCNLGFYIDEDKTDRFLVLNTPYKEGQIYYGKAYVTGTANIFVTEQLTEILVDVKTEQGTRIDIPMYGNAELEESKVVEFRDLDREDIADSIFKKIDLSNVELDLNFDVTDDAKLKLIFNEKTGDEINVTGNGKIGIGVDALGDVSMIGTYTITEGVYNFVLGPLKQDFIIQEGGEITWTGTPEDANLNITTYNRVTANFADVGVGSIDSRNSASQEVYTILELSGRLSAPVVTLNIEAPKATESERAILNSIKSNKDELQRQFFSLLLLKKFVPLNGAVTGGSSGVADVFLSQVNTFLNNFSGDTKLAVGYTSSDQLDQESVTLSAQRNLGQNFVLRTSFGYSNSAAATAGKGSSSQLIGDMSLEYLINSDGTFRVNLFNESNENNVIQDNATGMFTQGVGLHYQEDFNTLEDFKLLQFVLDWFRKNKHIKRTKRRQLVNVKEEIPMKGTVGGTTIIQETGNAPSSPGKKPEPASGGEVPVEPKERKDAILPEEK